MVSKVQIQNVLKALAVAGAFMVPLAGFPLAALVAKKLYGDSVSFEKVKEVLSQLIQMKKVKQEEVSFKDWLVFSEMINVQSPLNLLKNREETLVAFGLMEGDLVAKRKGKYTIDDAIEWLKGNPEDGNYVIYGDGGTNRYFVYPNGDIKFSAGHAMYPSKQTIQKAKDLGFQIH